MAQSRTTKAILLSSGEALSALVGLATVMVLARLFSKEDYAAYRQTLLAFSFLVPLVTLGLPTALFYFLPNEKERPRAVLVENVLLLAAGGLLIALFLLLGGNYLLARWFDNPELATTLRIFIPYPLAMLPASAFGACLLARGHATSVAVFNVVSRALLLGAVLLPLLFVPRPAMAVTGYVSASVLTSFVALGLMFRACRGGDWRPSAAGIKSQLGYSVPIGLGGLVGQFERNLDKLFVSAMCGPAAFAVYVNGAFEIPLIAVITSSVTSVLVVDYTKLYAEGRIDEIIRLIHSAMIKCGIILIPLMFFLFVTAPEVMTILFGSRYADSAAIFRIYLLMLPVRTLTFGALLRATGYGHYILPQAVLTLFANAVLTWVGIHLVGPIGAVIATVAVVWLVAVPYYVILFRRILGSSASTIFPWRTMARLHAAAAVPAAVVALMLSLRPFDNPIVTLIAAAVLYGIIAVPIFTRIGLIRTGAAVYRIRRLWATRVFFS